MGLKWWEHNKDGAGKATVCDFQVLFPDCLTLFVRGLDGINLPGCSGGQDLHQHLLVRACSLRVKRRKNTWRGSSTCSLLPRLFSFVCFISSNCSIYLNGVTEGCDVIHDRWGHQTHNQVLKFAAELRLQVIHQILSQHRNPGQAW